MQNKLIKALQDLLVFMHCCDETVPVSAVYKSPIDQVRAQADAMEARDKAIKQARDTVNEALSKPEKG